MKNILKYAKSVGHEIIGKLTRYPEKEVEVDCNTLEMKHGNFKFYMDEVNNEYIVTKHDICIITADGGVI